MHQLRAPHPHHYLKLPSAARRDLQHTQCLGPIGSADVQDGHDVDDEAPLLVAEAAEERNEDERGEREAARAAVDQGRREGEGEGEVEQLGQGRGKVVVKG